MKTSIMPLTIQSEQSTFNRINDSLVGICDIARDLSTGDVGGGSGILAAGRRNWDVLDQVATTPVAAATGTDVRRCDIVVGGGGGTGLDLVSDAALENGELVEAATGFVVIGLLIFVVLVAAAGGHDDAAATAAAATLSAGACTRIGKWWRP